jgi:hypothetical protein
VLGSAWKQLPAEWIGSLERSDELLALGSAAADIATRGEQHTDLSSSRKLAT